MSDTLVIRPDCIDAAEATKQAEQAAIELVDSTQIEPHTRAARLAVLASLRYGEKRYYGRSTFNSRGAYSIAATNWLNVTWSEALARLGTDAASTQFQIQATFEDHDIVDGHINSRLSSGRYRYRRVRESDNLQQASSVRILAREPEYETNAQGVLVAKASGHGVFRENGDFNVASYQIPTAKFNLFRRFMGFLEEPTSDERSWKEPFMDARGEKFAQLDYLIHTLYQEAVLNPFEPSDS